MKKHSQNNNLDFLKILKKFTLESKLIVCQHYSSRIMSSSMIDMRKVLQENIMPWEIEAFAAYSIVYDDDNASEILDKKTFSDTITLIRTYWHNGLTEAKSNGEFPEVFMMISALQQFSVQGVILQKLYRYHYFFTFKNDNLDMKKVFLHKMRITYERLEEFALIMYICYSKEVHDLIKKEEITKILEEIFRNKDIFKLITIEKDDYKKKLTTLYNNNIVDQYYGLKIQYIYPFISDKECTYVPSPYLIIQAVTESMLNRITYKDETTRKAIGKEIIEKYVFDIVSQLNTVTWISQEFEYNKGKDKCLTSDIIAAEDDKVIFYDTKAITPSLKLRKFDDTEIEKNIEIYAKGIIQVYKQIKNYSQSLFQLDKNYSKDHLFGIVVVLEDAVVSREKVYNKAYSILKEKEDLSKEEQIYICSHIKILPLRDIESMVLQNTSLIPELLLQVDNPEKWYDYTYSNPSTKNGLIALYDQYVQDIKDRAEYTIRKICNPFSYQD